MIFLKIASLSTLLIGALAVGNACTDNCINNLFDAPANVGCPVKGEAGCICVKPGFRDGLQQCAVAGCKYTGSLDELVQVRCGANKLAPESSAAPSSSATLSSTSAPSASSSAPVATSSTSSTAPTSTSQASTQTSSGTAQQSVASTSSATASATTSSPAQTSSADSVSTGSGGLSHAAGVGIGVGVAAAVVAAAVVGFCVFRNRKKGQQQSHHSMEISKPLPGSGRTYPADERTSLDKYNNDIEMSSNRYEDMAQGQQPRTMV